MQFKELGLDPKVLQAVEEKGYSDPTPIQAQAVPVVLEKQDVIGSAQTGSGKTAAFALPILSLLKKPGKLRALVLAPTRELAHQIRDNFEVYGKYTGLRIALLHGGVGYGPQKKKLADGVDIVVATPGRLLDHISQKTIHLKTIECLVLDEVDRMLDMGFIEDVRRIIRYCPEKRQTLLFSATVPDAIRRLSQWALTEPVDVTVGAGQAPAETIEHAIYPVDGIQKFDLLSALLETISYERLLIFTRTKVDADRITRWLTQAGREVLTMHADRSQRERQEALKSFKEGHCNVLVATDVASRGLDVSGVSHVINYNVPHNPEDYVHRIGRTGRAATTGQAYTLFSTDEFSFLKEIERFIGSPIPRGKLDGFAYRNDPLIASKPVRKKRNRGFGANRPRRF